MASRVGQTLLKGHAAAHSGKTVGKPGCCEREIVNVAGEGHLLCECGEYSPHMASDRVRRVWHRVHKEEVLAGKASSLKDKPKMHVPTPPVRPRPITKSVAKAVGTNDRATLVWELPPSWNPRHAEVVEALIKAHTRDGRVPDKQMLRAASAAGVLFGFLWQHGDTFLDALERAGYYVVRKEEARVG